MRLPSDCFSILVTLLGSVLMYVLESEMVTLLFTKKESFDRMNAILTRKRLIFLEYGTTQIYKADLPGNV